ncbi:MAG: DUF58 domain-containing protein [Polyangiaceae bacterium]|nr:DUF58 domain-containing protein [Polyangiaceae bacterium]
MASGESAALRGRLDWGRLGSLSLRVAAVTEGLLVGAHRSVRRGAGVEFGGHRQYVPGDDLRWLDRRALMRHERLLVREFETDTETSVRLVLDASASMRWASEGAPGRKLDYAALVLAAVGRVALATGDPVALEVVAGRDAAPVPPSVGQGQFERLVAALERVVPDGSVTEGALAEALSRIARGARRGAVVVLASDLLDWPSGALEAFVGLGAGRRRLVAVQVLDPAEAQFPWSGPQRLRSSEGDLLVETDGDAVRGRYQAALLALQRRWSDALLARGGRLVRTGTTEDPLVPVREVLRAVEARG